MPEMQDRRLILVYQSILGTMIQGGLGFAYVTSRLGEEVKGFERFSSFQALLCCVRETLSDWTACFVMWTLAKLWQGN